MSRALRAACHALGALAFVVAMAVPSDPARAGDIKTVWALGDSLSDSGNFREILAVTRAAAQLPSIDEPPAIEGYNDGRYTDGFLWVERLAALAGAASIQNLAVAGAFANEDGAFLHGDDIAYGLIGQAERVDARKDDLATVTIGAHDYRAWLGSIGADRDEASPAGSCALAGLEPLSDTIDACVALIVADITDALSILHDNRVRHVLLSNLPDLGRTPRAAAVEIEDPGTVALLSAISLAHNEALEAAVRELRLILPALEITLLDFAAMSDALFLEPPVYGLADTTSPCLLLTPTPENPRMRTRTGFCPTPLGGVPQSTSFLFWDESALSGYAHDLLGLFAHITLKTDARLRIGANSRQKVINARALDKLRRYARKGKPAFEVVLSTNAHALSSQP